MTQNGAHAPCPVPPAPPPAAPAAPVFFVEACAASPPQGERLVLQLTVPHDHGSTALLGVLMSSRRIATLCRANTLQCEGQYLLASAGFDRLGPWPMDAVLKEYGGWWDLQRPVFAAKETELYLRPEAVHVNLEGCTNPEGGTP